MHKPQGKGRRLKVSSCPHAPGWCLRPLRCLIRSRRSWMYASTLADAAGIEPRNNLAFDGASLWPSIQDGVVHERDDLIMFASVRIYGSFKLTAFDDEWKLVQEMEQDQLSTTVTNYLFRISEDSTNTTWRQNIPISLRKWRALLPTGAHLSY